MDGQQPGVHTWQPSATSTKRAARMVQILTLLSEGGSMSVGALVSRLGVSAATLRRDLTDLEDQGLLSRTRGGARSDAGVELPVRLRDTKYPLAKHAIAVRAAQLLPSGRNLAVAISGGSTTAEVARQLVYRRNLTIVTNSLTTVTEVAARPNLQVIMTGGVLRSSSFELVGGLAETAFNGLNVNVAVLGADGVSAEHGVTTHNHIEARANSAMVQHGQRLIVVADGSKIGRVTLAKVADAAAIGDLVTDVSADPRELARIADTGVRVHLVEVRRGPRIPTRDHDRVQPLTPLKATPRSS